MADQQHQHTDHDGDHDDHGLAHTASIKVLLGTFGALLVLTAITVLAAQPQFDNGPRINLLVAMAIATTKATLVAVFFMHLKYDKKFHAVVLLSAVIFAALFVGFALMDRGAYLPDVIWDVNNPPSNP